MRFDRSVAKVERGQFNSLPCEDPYLPVKSCRSVIEDREGHLWIATGVEAVDLVVQSRRRLRFVKRIPVGQHQIRAMYQDREGHIWIGSKESLTQYLAVPRTPVDFGDGIVPAMEHTHALMLSPGQVAYSSWHTRWELSANGEWVTSTARSAGRQNEPNTPPSELLASTPTGSLTEYDVRVIHQSIDGTMWFGTAGGGLNFLRGKRFSVFRVGQGLVSDHVFGLSEEPDGTMWIGTRNGLSRLKEGRFSNFTTRQGLVEDLIKFLIMDDFGDLWLGGNHGISRVSKAQLEEVVAGKRSVVEPMLLTQSDGLPTDECSGEFQPSAAKDSEGRIWAPTVRGLVVIDPRKFKAQETARPRVLIEAIFSNGDPAFTDVKTSKPRQPSAQIVKLGEPNHQPFDNGSRVEVSSELGAGPLPLPAGGGDLLEVQFTTHELSDPGRVAFQYRLRGASEHWRDAGRQRSAHFSHLGPGSYVFEARVSSRGRSQGNPVASVPFTITPFFWQTKWFATVCVLVPVSALILASARRIRNVRRQAVLDQAGALDKEKAEAERRLGGARLEHTASLANERARIARKLHDEVGGTLTHALKLVEIASRERDLVDRSRDKLVKLGRAITDALQSVREGLWLAGPVQRDLDQLAEFLCHIAQESVDGTGLRLRLEVPSLLPKKHVSPEFCEHVILSVRELLQNVLKHSKAAQVRFHFSFQEEMLRLFVLDDGCGFEQAPMASPKPPDGGRSRQEGQGYPNLRSHMAAICGEMRVESVTGAGTRVSMEMPVPILKDL